MHVDHAPDRLGRALLVVTALFVPVALACAVGIVVDDRDVIGEPV